MSKQQQPPYVAYYSDKLDQQAVLEYEDAVLNQWAHGDVPEFARLISRPYYNLLDAPGYDDDDETRTFYYRRPIRPRRQSSDADDGQFPWELGDTMRVFTRDSHRLEVTGELVRVTPSRGGGATGELVLAIKEAPGTR